MLLTIVMSPRSCQKLSDSCSAGKLRQRALRDGKIGRRAPGAGRQTLPLRQETKPRVPGPNLTQCFRLALYAWSSTKLLNTKIVVDRGRVRSEWNIKRMNNLSRFTANSKHSRSAINVFLHRKIIIIKSVKYSMANLLNSSLFSFCKFFTAESGR